MWITNNHIIDPPIKKVPWWFSEGTKFRSKTINKGKNICEIIKIDGHNVTVRVKAAGKDENDPYWLLNYMIYAFENKQYELLNTA